MPSFWDHGDVAFRISPAEPMIGQIDAIWTYLSPGRSMTLPAGLAPTGGFELVPTDQPIVHRTFIEPGLFVPGQIGVAVVVGYPEHGPRRDSTPMPSALPSHGAARFFDAKGQWEGRGGKALGPLGTDVLHMPDGPAFAVLASPTAAVAQNGCRRTQHRRPVQRLRSRQKGTADVSLRARRRSHRRAADSRGGKIRFARAKLPSDRKARRGGLYFLAASGPKIESKSPGVWSVGGKYTVKVDAHRPDSRRFAQTGNSAVADSRDLSQR